MILQDFNKNIIYRVLSLLIVLGFTSCKKETEYLYEINSIDVLQNNGGNKQNVKSTTEFISIAYADIFGSNITTTTLQTLNTVYTAFGDKKLIEDRIIRAFINDAAANIPTSVSVSGDTTAFIKATYRKIYNRDANEFEEYYLKLMIHDNQEVDARLVYYSLMTSDEYRYY